MWSQAKPIYYDSCGNQLRSSLELRVARALQNNGISYTVGPRLVVPDHAFYPDFVLADDRKIIEAIGYAADWYWDKTAEKVKLIIENHDHVHVAIVTPFLKMMMRRLVGVPRVILFSPYQLEQLIQWCRGMPGFT